MNKSKLEKKIDKDYEKLIDTIHAIMKNQSTHLLANFNINELRNGHTELDYAFSISILTIFKIIADDVKDIKDLNLLAEVRNLVTKIEKIFEHTTLSYIS